MWPKLDYQGHHERGIDPDGTTYRFLVVIADFDREEFSSLPNQAGMIAKPFSKEASVILAHNEPVMDLNLEG